MCDNRWKIILQVKKVRVCCKNTKYHLVLCETIAWTDLHQRRCRYQVGKEKVPTNPSVLKVLMWKKSQFCEPVYKLYWLNVSIWHDVIPMKEDVSHRTTKILMWIKLSRHLWHLLLKVLQDLYVLNLWTIVLSLYYNGLFWEWSRQLLFLRFFPTSGSFCLLFFWIQGLRKEDVVHCADFKAPWGKFVIRIKSPWRVLLVPPELLPLKTQVNCVLDSSALCCTSQKHQSSCPWVHQSSSLTAVHLLSPSRK